MPQIENWDKFKGDFGYSMCDLSGFADSVMYVHRVVDAEAYVSYDIRENMDGEEYRKYTAVVITPDKDAKNKQTIMESHEDLSGRNKQDAFDYIRKTMKRYPLNDVQEKVVESMSEITGYSEEEVMDYFRGNKTMKGLPFRYYQNIEGEWDGVRLSSPAPCETVEVAIFRVPMNTNNPIEEGDVDTETWFVGKAVGNIRDTDMEWNSFTSQDVFQEHFENALTLFQ